MVYRKYPKSLLEHGHITCQQVYITARYASRNVCIASSIYSPRIYIMYKKLRLCYVRDCVAVLFLLRLFLFFFLLFLLPRDEFRTHDGHFIYVSL